MYRGTGLNPTKDQAVFETTLEAPVQEFLLSPPPPFPTLSSLSDEAS